MKDDDDFLLELEQQLAQELAQDELHEYNRLLDEQFDEFSNRICSNDHTYLG